MSKKTIEVKLGPGEKLQNYKQCQFCTHFYRFQPYNPYEGKVHLTPSNECSVRGFDKVNPLGPTCYMYEPNLDHINMVNNGTSYYLKEDPTPAEKVKKRWKKAKVVETVGELAEALKNVDPDTSLAVLFGAHKCPEHASGFVSVETKDYTETTPLDLYLYIYKHADGRIRTPTLLITNHGSDINIRPNLGALNPEDLEEK